MKQAENELYGCNQSLGNITKSREFEDITLVPGLKATRIYFVDIGNKAY